MYRWNKYELILKKLLASLLNKQEYNEHYDLILRQLRLEQELFKPDDILVSTKNDDISYSEALRNFASGLEVLSEDTYLSIAEIFLMIEDHNAFKMSTNLPKIKLTDKELLMLVREMIESLGISEFLRIYDKIITPSQHRLNIQRNDLKYTAGTLEYVGGITLNDPLFDKSYINIFRNYTIEDVEILFHEAMHSIFYSIMRPIYKKDINNIYLLQELEGQFGSLYAYNYLGSIGYKKEAYELKRDYINSILTSSFLFIVNHVLFATSKSQEFDLLAAEKRINEQLKIPIVIKPEELPTYLSMNGFETVTTLISSLIALEILDKDISTKEQIELLYSIKKSDSIMLDRNIKKHEVDFKANNFKTLRKVYEELYK